MPLVEVRAFDRRFEDQEVTERLIARITDAMCEVLGEAVRSETWVIIDGVSPGRWGFGGTVRE
jgi:phenylpyruvate tautomerase PptA (4-oxalocrotonate tautomerase family)